MLGLRGGILDCRTSDGAVLDPLVNGSASKDRQMMKGGGFSISY